MKNTNLLIFLLVLLYLASPLTLAKKHKKKKDKHRGSTTQRKPLVYCARKKLDVNNPAEYCDWVIDDYVRRGVPVPIGTTCLSPVTAVHPTQHSIGRALQMCKKHIVEAKFKNLKDFIKYIMYNPAPAVVGRSWGKPWSIYITDHHHMASAISIAHDSVENIEKYRLLRICVISDLTHMEEAEFEDTLVNKGWLWPYNRFGKRVAISRVPPTIEKLQLADDPFRSFSEYVRDGHGYIKCGIAKTKRFVECKNKADVRPFFEFIWANFLREELAKLFPVHVLYNLTWEQQIPYFNQMMYEAYKLATTPFIVNSYKHKLPGLNLKRKYLHRVRVNRTSGCDRMYNELIFRENFFTGDDEPEAQDEQKLSVPWFQSRSDHILIVVAVFVGMLLALLMIHHCVRSSHRESTEKLNAQSVPSYS